MPMEDDERHNGARTLTSPEPEREAEPSAFASVFSQYQNSMEALREFSSRLTPLVSDIETVIAEERRRKVDQILASFRDRLDERQLEELRKFAEWLVNSIEGETDEESSFTLEGNVSAEVVLAVLTVVQERSPTYAHHELLNRSILMSLVGYFEVVVADLAHAFYRLIPKAASNDDKVLSVNELRTFESVDDAMEFVISERVDDLLRGSIEDWQQFFQSRMNVDLRSIVPDWPQWSEMFQRRHIIVHAGGKVTRRYLEKVDWDNVTWPERKPEMGSLVAVDDKYVQRALDIFEVSGALLCQAVAKKLGPDDHEGRLRALMAAIYHRLKTPHWYVAERLSTWGNADSAATEEQSLMFKFNRWLAIKRQDKWPEVQGEVDAFDCSAKDPKFRIALASLRERADEFFSELPAALASGLTAEAVREWPILEEIRSDKRFERELAKAERQTRARKRGKTPAAVTVTRTSSKTRRVGRRGGQD